MTTINKAAIEAAAKALAGGEFDLELSEETDAAAEARDEKNRAEGHDDYGYPKSREKFSRDAEAAMLAASPEPPASVSESPDSSAKPIMTDDEFKQLVSEVGQPEGTFPYLMVPLDTTRPADKIMGGLDDALNGDFDVVHHFHADPVKAQLVEALKTSITAIDDWLHIYAEELCNEPDVAASKVRVHENGTLAYIAYVQDKNRVALAAAEENQQIPVDTPQNKR